LYKEQVSRINNNMQVNSAQDWLTERKRQIVAATYHSVPPPQSKKYNYVYISAAANNANQYQRYVIPTLAPGSAGAVGGSTYSTKCCLSNSLGAPGAFATVTDRGVVHGNVVPPLGVKAAIPVTSG
jgi:hypothetical protein